MQRLLRSWIFWAASLVVGAIYIMWAHNIYGVHFGENVLGAQRFVHRLFVVTPLLALAAGIGCLAAGFWWTSIKSGGGGEKLAHGVEGRRLIWLLGAACVLGYATLVGVPLFNEQRAVRATTPDRTYLLQGTSGGSGQMFYRLFSCDRLELICVHAASNYMVLSQFTAPGLQIDSAQQTATISEDGQAVCIVQLAGAPAGRIDARLASVGALGAAGAAQPGCSGY